MISTQLLYVFVCQHFLNINYVFNVICEWVRFINIHVFFHQCFLIKANFFFIKAVQSITESAANKMNFSSVQRSWAFCSRNKLNLNCTFY